MKTLLIRKATLALGIISILFLYSCTKELDPTPSTETLPKTMADLVISESFNFSTSQTILLKLNLEDYIGLPASKIEIFDGNPNENGNIIKSGITDKDQNFEANISIPSYLNQLHVRRTNHDGSIETATIDIDSNEIEYIFNNYKNTGGLKNGVTGPGCTSCTTTITNHQNGILTINAGETVCITTGASFTGGLSLNGGTLKVCGTITIQWINGGGTIIINNDGAFISNSLNMNSSDLTIENYSDAFMVSAGPNIKGTFKNWGYIALAGANINSGGKFYNYGIIGFSNHYVNNSFTYNEGVLNLAGNVSNNGSATFENHCKVNVAGNFNNNSTLDNYSYMNINGRLSLNSNGDLQLFDQALVETVDMTINKNIVGNGNSYSKIVVTGNTTINSAVLSGNLDFCDENGIETNNGTIEPSVTFCDASIPEDYCNPGSTGTGGSSGGNDSDGDNVDDEYDDYPEDPDKAFNNYYPNENSFGTLAFEDLWPYKGDYDFNDLVIDYRFNTVTNSNDNAVEILATFKVMAIGAGYKNGFGIQFPFSDDVIENVSGDFSYTQNIISNNSKNLENNQDKAVMILFDNAFTLLPHPGGGTGVNVQNGSEYIEPQEIQFTISFNYPMSPENLGTAPFNPFIFVNGDRGREIHMKGDEPTDLVNNDLFGTGQDDSDPTSSNYYKTENNLPWAINIVSGFDYPIEKSAIIEAYNYFSNWAESSGIQYPNWYSNDAGYRNANYIYNP